MADQFGYLCSIEAPGAPQCLYASFQEMGIKDDFHEKSILVCIDELCGQQTDNVSSCFIVFRHCELNDNHYDIFNRCACHHQKICPLQS